MYSINNMKIILIYGIDNAGRNTLIRSFKNNSKIFTYDIENSFFKDKPLTSFYKNLSLTSKEALFIFKNQKKYNKKISLSENFINYAYLKNIKKQIILLKSSGLEDPRLNRIENVNILYKDYKLYKINVRRNLIISLFSSIFEYYELNEGSLDEIIDNYINDLIKYKEYYEYAWKNLVNIDHYDILFNNFLKIEKIISEIINEKVILEKNDINDYNTPYNIFITNYEYKQINKYINITNIFELYDKITKKILHIFPETVIIPLKRILDAA